MINHLEGTVRILLARHFHFICLYKLILKHTYLAGHSKLQTRVGIDVRFTVISPHRNADTFFKPVLYHDHFVLHITSCNRLIFSPLRSPIAINIADIMLDITVV